MLFKFGFDEFVFEFLDFLGELNFFDLDEFGCAGFLESQVLLMFGDDGVFLGMRGEVPC